MAEEGYEIPPLPCALIEAKNRKEAAEKILLISSQYGRVTDEGLYEFLSTNELDFGELEPNAPVEPRKFSRRRTPTDCEAILPRTNEGSCA
jgi:hypothetical protein